MLSVLLKMTWINITVPHDRKNSDFTRKTPLSKKLRLAELHKIPQADHFYRLHTLYLLKPTLATYTKDQLMFVFPIVLCKDNTHSSAHVLQQLRVETTEKRRPAPADRHALGAQRNATFP